MKSNMTTTITTTATTVDLEFTDDVRGVLEDLAFLRMVRPGQKIDMDAKKYIDPLVWGDPHNWVAWFHRMLKSDSRERTIRYIVDLIQRTKDVMRAHPEFRALVMQYLGEARSGVEALRSTYSAHPGTLATLEVLLEEMGALLGVPPRAASPLPLPVTPKSVTSGDVATGEGGVSAGESARDGAGGWSVAARSLPSAGASDMERRAGISKLARRQRSASTRSSGSTVFPITPCHAEDLSDDDVSFI